MSGCFFLKHGVHPQFLMPYSQVIRDLRQCTQCTQRTQRTRAVYINFVSPNVVARIKQKYANRTDRDRQFRQYRENKLTCKRNSYNYYENERKNN